MNHAAILKAIFWKEWREHRWKYIVYWLALNFPILAVSAGVGVSSGARAPFADLANATAMKYIGVALLAEAFAVSMAFLFFTGFLAAATFSPELEDGSLFFVYEQPLSRTRYVSLKLLNGLLHVAAATMFAVLFAPLAASALTLISGRVTAAALSAILGTVMMAAARAAVWCCLVSLVAFTGCALVTSLLPRWWMATVATVILIAVFISVGTDFYDFLDPALDGTGSINIGFSSGSGSGSSQWLTITSPFRLNKYAPWRVLQLLTTIALTTVFSVATGVLYTRKEQK